MRPASTHKKESAFDPDTFLATIGEGRKILAVPKKQTIYTQGDEADAVFWVQKGKVLRVRVPHDREEPGLRFH
jgi:CRP-like cAMP-binding protein